MEFIFIVTAVPGYKRFVSQSENRGGMMLLQVISQVVFFYVTKVSKIRLTEI